MGLGEMGMVDAIDDGGLIAKGARRRRCACGARLHEYVPLHPLNGGIGNPQCCPATIGV